MERERRKENVGLRALKKKKSRKEPCAKGTKKEEEGIKRNSE